MLKNIDTLISGSNTPVMQENHPDVTKKPMGPSTMPSKPSTNPTNFVASNATPNTSRPVPPLTIGIQNINTNSVGTPPATGSALSPPTSANPVSQQTPHHHHHHLPVSTSQHEHTIASKPVQPQQAPPIVTKPLTSSRVSFIDLEEISKQSTSLPSHH